VICTRPRDCGRSWHTDSVKPDHGCGLPPAMSADSVPTWNWMSGRSDSGSAFMKQPPWLMPMASGPLRSSSHCRPSLPWPHSVRSWSLLVMGLVHS
jgi:hypothetical protein